MHLTRRRGEVLELRDEVLVEHADFAIQGEPVRA
jgi:hypothetical protein